MFCRTPEIAAPQFTHREGKHTMWGDTNEIGKSSYPKVMWPEKFFPLFRRTSDICGHPQIFIGGDKKFGENPFEKAPSFLPQKMVSPPLLTPNGFKKKLLSSVRGPPIALLTQRGLSL